MKLKKTFTAAVVIAMLLQLFAITASAAVSFKFEAENGKSVLRMRVIELDREDISGGKYIGYMFQPNSAADVVFNSDIGGELFISPYSGSKAKGVFNATINGKTVEFETEPTGNWTKFEKQKAFCVPVVKGQNTMTIKTVSGGANFDYFVADIFGEIEKPEVEINTYEMVDQLKNTENERLLSVLGISGDVDTAKEFINRGEFAYMTAGLKVDRSYVDEEIVKKEIPPITFQFDDSSKVTRLSGSGSVSNQWEPPALYGMVNTSTFKITDGVVNLDNYDTVTFRYGSAPQLVYASESLFVYIDNDPSKVIGSFVPQPAGGWDDPINLSTKISGGYSGEHEIYFKFVPVDHALRIESLTFENSTPRMEISYKGVDGEKTVNYQATGKVFADVTAETPYANEIEFLKENKIITDSVRFRPEDTITVGEATKMIMHTLGYNDKNVDDYIIKATSLGLLKGISYNFNEELTMEKALKLIVNALTADSLEISLVSSKGIGYSSDNTILESLFGVKRIRNKQVTATSLSSLESSETNISEGMIAVDNVVYKTTEEGIEALLGFKVNAYVKDDKMITITPSNSNVFERIRADEISSVSEEYIKADTGKGTKSFKIADEPVVILNGRAYTRPLEGNTDILKPEVGNVYLLSTEGERKSDIIFIENFEMKVVSNAESEKQNILFTDGTGVNAENAIFYMDGERAFYQSVGRGDVIALAQNEENCIIHIFKNASVHGYVAAIGDEEATVGETLFETLQGATEGVKLGDEVTAYIAPGGKIFCFDVNGKNYRENLALIIDCQPVTKRGTTYYELLIISTNGDKKWVDTTENVKVDGESADVIAKLSETAVTEYGWNGGAFVQPIKYKNDKNGKITEIYTSGGEDPDLKFNILTPDIYAYGGNIHFYNVRLEGAVMFQIPSADRNEDVNDEKYYQIGNVKDTLRSEYLVFGLDKSNKASVVISKYVEKGSWNMNDDRGGTMLVFDRAVDMTEYTGTDELKGQLIFCYEKGKKQTFFAPDIDGVKFADNLKRGDMFLVISKDANGFALKKEIYASPAELMAGPSVTYSTTHKGSNSYDRYTLTMYCGSVVGRQGEEATVWVQNGNSDMEFDNNYVNTRTIKLTGCSVYLYDVNENEVSVGTGNDITPEDLVIFRENLGSVKDVLVIKNYR